MLYAIKAYESQYNGLHGIVDYAVVEEDCYEEACMVAEHMSEEVLDSYSLYPKVEEYETYDEYAEAWLESIAYEIWGIPDTKGKTRYELNKEFYNDPEGFVAEYCKEVQ